MAVGLTGMANYAFWGPTTATTSCGKVTSGSWTIDPNLAEYEAIAGQYNIEGGLVKVSAQFTFLVQSMALIQEARRASYPNGALNANKFALGDSATGVLISGAKIDTLGLNFKAGGVMEATVGIKGLTYAADAPSPMSIITTQKWRWFEGACSIAGGTTLGIVEASFELNNQLEWEDPDLDVKGAGALRLPTALKQGIEKTKVSFTTKVDPAQVLDGDYISQVVAAVISAVNGASNRTFTFGLLVPGPYTGSFAIGNALKLHKQEFMGNPGCLTITTAG